MIQHIVPSKDIIAHITESTCGCNPTIKMHEGNMIFVHNAHDSRELLEAALGVQDSHESLAAYRQYVGMLTMLCMHKEMTIDQFADRMVSAIERMYEHWRKMDVEIVFTDK